MSQAWLEASPAQLIEGINSDEPTLQLPAVTQFRKLLSIPKTPPITEVIAAGVVPRFVQFLQFADNPMLQSEAAWALTNIASGTSEHTRAVISNGAVPILVQLLTSPNDDVREQAVWALGNIAGDSPECRDLVLSHQTLAPLLEQLNPQSKISMVRRGTWTLSNLCRGKPQPAWHMVAPALPVLTQLVSSDDEEVLADACWALSYLCDGSNDKIQAVLDTGICARIVELMGHQSVKVQTPALRLAGNIVTGDDHQTQCVINCSALPLLRALVSVRPVRPALQWGWGLCISDPTLRAPRRARNMPPACSAQTAPTSSPHLPLLNSGAYPHPLPLNPLCSAQLNSPKKGIRKEACWAISNIMAGTREQIQAVIEANVIPPLTHLFDTAEFGTKKEVAWSISNATSGGSPEQIRYLVQQGCIKPLCDLLTCNDPRLVTVALEGIENVLKAGKQEELSHGGTNPYTTVVDEAEGIDKLKQLQDHSKAMHILETFMNGFRSDRMNTPPSDLSKLAAALPLDIFPHHFICPISQDVMADPVKTIDNHTYDRAFIERWFKRKTTSPLTGLRLTSKALVPHHALRLEIEEFVKSLLPEHEPEQHRAVGTDDSSSAVTSAATGTAAAPAAAAAASVAAAPVAVR
jgi:importin subunit alpha-6/7